MRFLHSLLLVLVLGICYLLFFRSQPPGSTISQEDMKTIQAGAPDKRDDSALTPPVHSQYKADMDRAHAVANKMKAAREEANSF